MIFGCFFCFLRPAFGHGSLEYLNRGSVCNSFLVVRPFKITFHICHLSIISDRIIITKLLGQIFHIRSIILAALLILNVVLINGLSVQTIKPWSIKIFAQAILPKCNQSWNFYFAVLQQALLRFDPHLYLRVAKKIINLSTNNMNCYPSTQTTNIAKLTPMLKIFQDMFMKWHHILNIPTGWPSHPPTKLIKTLQ